MKKLYIETYGCQMNVADSEVVASVMQMAGYETTDNIDEADAVFLNTCSVRDNAEQKIYHRLEALAAERKRRRQGDKERLRVGDHRSGMTRGQGEWLVQLNGELVNPSEIPARIEAIRAVMAPENAEKLTVNLRADRHTPMGLISDVKEALQQSYALRINYSGTEARE